MCRFVLAVFALSVFSACQPAAIELTEERKGEIAAEVELLHTQWVDAWKAADVDRGMSFFADTPELIEAVDGEVTQGFSTIAQGWRSTFASIESQRIRISDVHTVVLAPDVVCLTEDGIYVVTDTAGVVGPETPYVYTSIWVRDGGQWKIHFGHQSSPTAEDPEE